jgi:hypothetical protein
MDLRRTTGHENGIEQGAHFHGSEILAMLNEAAVRQKNPKSVS